MRIFITDKDTDLASLTASLARSGRKSEAMLERLKALNPQLASAKKLAAGTPLILPDSQDLKPGIGEAVGAPPLAEINARLREGIRDVDARFAERAQRLAADHAAVRDALKVATARRLIDSDPVLKEQLAAYEAGFKAQQTRLADAQEHMAAAAKLAEAELAKLQRLLG